MHETCFYWCCTNLRPDDVQNKEVIEVGSMDVNGSIRPFVESWKPKSYLGVDFASGKGVDRVCDAGELVQTFGCNSYDVVLSTEMLEHVKDWRGVVSNLKNILKPGGTLLITTRSKGFGYHAFPHDFWRYEVSDFQDIFSDMEILKLEKDPMAGVFLKARKPVYFQEANLNPIELFSILDNRRVREISQDTLQGFYGAIRGLEALVSIMGPDQSKQFVDQIAYQIAQNRRVLDL